MCTVCTEGGSRVGAGGGGGRLRQRSWCVRYGAGPVATLFAPRGWVAEGRGERPMGGVAAAGGTATLASLGVAAPTSARLPPVGLTGAAAATDGPPTGTAGVQAAGPAVAAAAASGAALKADAAAKASRRPGRRPAKQSQWVDDGTPVGGRVLTEAAAAMIGKSPYYSYVTARLKTAGGVPGPAGGDGALAAAAAAVPRDNAGGGGGGVSSGGGGGLQRTIGCRTSLGCPIDLLLWNDGRGRSEAAVEKAEEIGWWATQSLGGASGSGCRAGDAGCDDTAAGDSEAGAPPLVYPEEAPPPTTIPAPPVAAAKVMPSDWMPVSLLSVSLMRASEWKEVATRSANTPIARVPASWEPSAQAWVLLDIDGLHGLGPAAADDPVTAAVAAAATRAARRDAQLSGRLMVVRTGPSGLHLWAELREPRADPRGWFADPAVRVWYAALGGRVLAAVRRAGGVGGVVDMSSAAAGRFARRPGWRVLEEGGVFRSALVGVATARVRGRRPRWEASLVLPPPPEGRQPRCAAWTDTSSAGVADSWYYAAGQLPHSIVL